MLSPARREPRPPGYYMDGAVLNMMIAMSTNANLSRNKLRAGMIGMGMIFDDTYRPFFEHAHAAGLYRRDFGFLDIELSAVASRTGSRAEKYRQDAGAK